MPNELPLIGGACAIVDLKTGNIETSSRRLMVYGEGDETSSHGETEMVTQGAIKVSKQMLSKTDNVTFYTDNLSAVQGINEFVLGSSKISRILRSKLRENFRRLKPVMNKIKNMTASVEVAHELNDHGRSALADHQSIPCRLNRAADLSADDAARWEGIDVDGKVLPVNDSFGAIAEGRLGPPKNGGPVTLSCTRMVLGSDFRSSIREGMNNRLASYLKMSSIQGSTVNRVLSKETDVGASMKVRKLLPDFLYEATLRSLFYRERWTIQEVMAKYKEANKDSVTIFSRCGPLAKMCPFCANLGILKRDTYRHGRFFCTNPTMVAAREYCDTMLSARLTAEGLCWQAYSNDKFAIGSTKVTGRSIRDAPSNQDKSISWSKTRDEATLKAPGITDIIVSGTRIRCLQAICGTGRICRSKKK